MPTLIRFRVSWQGLSGLPGVNTFYSQDDTGLLKDLNPALRAFYEAIKTTLIPSGVQIVYPTVCDEIESETGVLTGTFVPSAQANTAGGGGTTYQAPTGMMVRWNTNGVVAGRRVRGRTFIVPTSTGIPSGGAPSSANITTLVNAANSFLATTSNSLMVWSRPTPPGYPGPARTGTFYTAQTAAVPAKFVVLRSRRD